MTAQATSGTVYFMHCEDLFHGTVYTYIFLKSVLSYQPEI